MAMAVSDNGEILNRMVKQGYRGMFVFCCAHLCEFLQLSLCFCIEKKNKLLKKSMEYHFLR